LFLPQRRGDYSLMDQPIILHCHIPKTAGTTVSAHLSGIFGKLHLSHYHLDPDFVLTPAILENLFAVNPCLRSLSSHHLRVFPTKIQGRRTHYITFLRDPSNTVISLLSYVQSNFKNLPPKAREFWPPEAPRLPLRDLAQWYVEKWGTTEASGQTRFFCHREVLEKHAGANAAGDVHAEIAFNVLKQFLFVGIVEEMPASIDVLDAKLHRLGIKLGREAFFGKLRHHNRNQKNKRNLRWLNSDDEVGRRILSCNSSDRFIYSGFKNELMASHRKMGGGGGLIRLFFPDRYSQTTDRDIPEDEPLICDWAAKTYFANGFLKATSFDKQWSPAER
jgi:hypothetical protein